MSLRLNREYDKLLPNMTDEEFSELKTSIQNEGQHYPIIVNENLEVLDGHHRYRACMELGIEPDFEVRKFEDKLHEKKFVIEANLRRRHLNNFQLVELAVPLLEIERALAKKRQSRDEQDLQLGLSPDGSEPEIALNAKTTEEIAKKAGVSTRTFERGKKILDEASEEEKQKLREGKESITHAYNEIQQAKKPIRPSILKHETPRDLQNKADLLAILERLHKGDLYCPSCGNEMFQCSKCHKTLEALLELKGPKPSEVQEATEDETLDDETSFSEE